MKLNLSNFNIEGTGKLEADMRRLQEVSPKDIRKTVLEYAQIGCLFKHVFGLELSQLETLAGFKDEMGGSPYDGLLMMLKKKGFNVSTAEVMQPREIDRNFGCERKGNPEPEELPPAISSLKGLKLGV